MCGIVGVVDARPVDAGLVARMRDELAHRGPDDAGLWASDDGRVVLGHRRLAVIDPRPEASQPFRSADGRQVLIFNGEIYNFAALRRELEGEGHRFRTRSDTEVLLAAYGRWGRACLERLSGMFALAIWDASTRRILCARDRAGEKPLYHARVNGAFLFASELKAIAAWPGFTRRLDPAALVDFFTFGFVADPRAIWEGCAKLPPGHWLEVDLTADGPGPERTGRYWDMEFAPDASVASWDEPVRDALEQAANEMAVSDVPLGALLSGGVDSSAVTAALSRAGHTVRSFTIGFDEAGYDERPFARQVADRYRTDHTERVVAAGDVEAVLERMVWHYDEPFNDYSYLPTFYLCRMARERITVALSGDGGDEVFAGYRRYQRVGRRAAQPPGARRLAGMAHAGARLFLASRHPLRRTLGQYAAAPAAMFADMLNLGFPLPLLARAARGPLRDAVAGHRPEDTVRAHLAAAPPAEVGLVNAMRYLDLKLTLAGGVLVKVDRASMAVSLEVRPVFLHRGLLRLAGRIPPEFLADGSHAKEALKAALIPWLPEEILYRKKMGFAMPLGRWLRGDLGEAVGRAAAGERLAGLMDPAVVEDLVRRHQSGAADAASMLHSLYFLDRWLARWAA